MKFNLFVGVDVSKSSLDAHLKPVGCHEVFSNDEQGFTEKVE